MRRRLLLVEDSGIMRKMISAMLEEEGYDVATAVDGRDGLVKVRSVRPDLIVSDFEMPEMNGPEFCKAVKADHELRAIPIVMLTTLGAVESKVVGLDSGADDYIQKPQKPEDVQEIFARIRAQLRIADLRAELADRNQQLEAAQAKLNLELELARKVQFGLMPKPPKSRGKLQVAVRYKPANKLGGDVYDILRLEGKRLGILMVDISGHGVNAALLSGMVKTLANPLISAEQGPGQVLASLDSSAEQYFPEGYFCTAFCFRIDENTGEFDYAGVGHPPVVIAGPDGSRLVESEAGLLGVGIAAGTTTKTDRLKPGESLLLYTDGLPDAMDPADKPFGTGRIQAVLEANRDESPATILDRVEAAVAQHVEPGQPHDDINLVLVQHPPEG